MKVSILYAADKEYYFVKKFILIFGIHRQSKTEYEMTKLIEHFRWKANGRMHVKLDQRNNPWKLTLFIPVLIVFYDEKGKLLCLNNYPPELKKWCDEFERLGEVLLSNQYKILATPPSSYGGSKNRDPEKKPKKLPDVVIKIDIRQMKVDSSTTSKQFKKMCIINVLPSSSKRRDITQDAGDKMQIKRSSIKNKKRIDKNNIFGGTKQRAAMHELGHLIGVRIDGKKHPVCDGNEDKCYGKSGSPEIKSLMGAGNKVSRKFYQVFADFLEVKKQEYGWMVELK